MDVQQKDVEKVLYLISSYHFIYIRKIKHVLFSTFVLDVS